MERLTTFEELRAYAGAAPRPLGLVPTMGAVHAGHMSLVERSSRECAATVATLFVNPAQFDDKGDFARYPRDAEGDLAALAAAGADAVFTPPEREVYPAGFATWVRMGGPALPLEGAARPGHFDGVATIVAKLLIGALPDAAYFGQKDGQQVAVVRRLVADLGLSVRVVAAPTVREADGLALSSRNGLLNAEQRRGAAALHRALQAGAAALGEGAGAAEAACRAVLAKEPQVSAVDYVALVDQATMAPWSGQGEAMLAAAVRVGSVRLIDNLLMSAD
ncbi:MAG: pantoate--beta-alanine ligase [Dehalococcoidia bacterium]|nr:pantoate--beta-alanine ligase [Dehalococcoidia bacterium]